MYPDPNPKNKKVDAQEKDKRQFTVLIVFIIIIGASLIAGILKFRQAKKEVREMTRADKIQDQVPGLRPPGGKEKKILEQRRPQQSDSHTSQGAPSSLVKKRLVPEIQDRPTQKRSVRNFVGKLSRLQLGKQYFKQGGQSFVEVENMAAIPLDQKDRYSAEEIIGERHNKLLIRLSKGESAPRESMGIALNTRTKRLAIITGTLKVRFKDEVGFNNRLNLIPSGQREKNAFAGIRLSLLQVEGPQDLEKLQKEQDYWAAKEDVKSAEVELLEAEIATHMAL
jgi:hypothetical protein